MDKYPIEFKLKAIKYYTEGSHSFGQTARHFNVGKSSVENWVKKYELHGLAGLSKNLKSSYSGDFKCDVLEYMHVNHLSFTETARQFNLAGNHMVARWERIYYEEGPQALYQENRGQRKKMSSKSEKKNVSKQTEEELIAENERLRMENEYLKKLDALVQERIKRENKKK